MLDYSATRYRGKSYTSRHGERLAIVAEHDWLFPGEDMFMIEDAQGMLFGTAAQPVRELILEATMLDILQQAVSVGFSGWVLLALFACCAAK